MKSQVQKLIAIINTEIKCIGYWITQKRTMRRNSIGLKVLTPVQPPNIDDLVNSYDLKITRSLTAVGGDIDVHRNNVPLLFREISAYAKRHDLLIYMRAADGEWYDVSKARLAKWIRCLSANQPTEIAVLDCRNRLLQRMSLNVWQRSVNAVQSTVYDAPAKKIISERTGDVDIKDLNCDRHIGPIDVVYTWVNADDRQWQLELEKFRSLDGIDRNRFQQVDELKYSIRSVFTYAPWVGNVFIFSNCSPPKWFKASDKIHWVMHSEVIPPEHLPLFNSHAIETYLYKIPGLSERFIYFNDDVFVAAPVRPTDFFNAYGQGVSRMEAYGMLHYLAGLTKDGVAEEWQHAAVNAGRLLYEQNKVLPTSLHHHAPFAISKSTYSTMVDCYSAEVEKTRQARFRSCDDCSFTSFLYHHYALFHGKAQYSSEGSYIVKASNYMNFYLSRSGRKMRFFCINDGGRSAENRGFKAFKQWYLDKRFPFKSPAER